MLFFEGLSLHSNEPLLEDLLAILKGEVSNKKSKNVDILHLASHVVRRMSGKNCFSLKPKTGMREKVSNANLHS